MGGATEETGEGRARKPGADPRRPERTRLRRRPLGYRRADVDAALAVRDEELAELRRDIAALWLAFAQHDRMLQELDASRAPTSGDPEPAPRPEPAAAAAETASIGAQLAELGDVLAAIEMATQTLESTYADEIRGSPRSTAPEPVRGDTAARHPDSRADGGRPAP